MNIAELRRKLLAAARLNPPGDAVPYAFEKRIMARIAGHPSCDRLALWNRSLWQAAAPCVAVMLLLGLWLWVSPPTENSGQTLAADLESAVYAPLDSLEDTW
jgi:hypothetical protein